MAKGGLTEVPRMWARLLRTVAAVVITVVVLPSLVTFHELGHAVAALALGGRVTDLHVFGLQFWPRLTWVGVTGNLAECNYSGVESERAGGLIHMAGAGGTLLLAALAVLVLWRWRPPRAPWWARAVLIGAGLWFLDMLTFMLPSFGIRRYIWTGTSWSEPYVGALAAGIPGWLFQGLTMLACAAVLVALVRVTTRRAPVPTKGTAA